MLQLLLQGLNNKDRKILDSVLDRADEELIEKTVRKLPVEAVLPLITELQHYIKVRLVTWMFCVALMKLSQEHIFIVISIHLEIR